MDRVFGMTTPTSTPVRTGGKLHKWRRVVLSICFVIFAGELGLCLILLPWLSNWEMSYIPVHSPHLSDIWMSPYFRGILSGPRPSECLRSVDRKRQARSRLVRQSRVSEAALLTLKGRAE